MELETEPWQTKNVLYFGRPVRPSRLVSWTTLIFPPTLKSVAGARVFHPTTHVLPGSPAREACFGTVLRVLPSDY